MFRGMGLIGGIRYRGIGLIEGGVYGAWDIRFLKSH